MENRTTWTTLTSIDLLFIYFIADSIRIYALKWMADLWEIGAKNALEHEFNTQRGEKMMKNHKKGERTKANDLVH